MALPIRLIWHLRMQRKQKLSIGGLFCFGWVCIIIATIRVVQLGSTSDVTSRGTPAPSWLAMWGIIEASIGMCLDNRMIVQSTWLTDDVFSCHDRLLSRALPRLQIRHSSVQTLIWIQLVQRSRARSKWWAAIA